MGLTDLVEERLEVLEIEYWKGCPAVQDQKFAVFGHQAVGLAGLCQLDELLVVRGGASRRVWKRLVWIQLGDEPEVWGQRYVGPRQMASVLLGLPALFSRWSVSSLIVARFAILLDYIEALFADVDKSASISQSGFKSKQLRFRRVANFAGHIGRGVLATGCGAGRARMGHLGSSSDLDWAILWLLLFQAKRLRKPGRWR